MLTINTILNMCLTNPLIHPDGSNNFRGNPPPPSKAITFSTIGSDVVLNAVHALNNVLEKEVGVTNEDEPPLIELTREQLVGIMQLALKVDPRVKKPAHNMSSVSLK